MRRSVALAVASVALLATLVTLLPAAFAQPPVSAGTNLIRNPGFEDPAGGATVPPSEWSNTTTSPFRSVPPDTYSDSSYSAYLHGTSGTYTQTVGIGASTIYRFAAYARANGSATETVKLEILNETYGVIDSFSWNGTNHGWLKRATYFATTDNAWYAKTTLEINGSDSSAEAWFDSITLEEKTPANCFIATAAYGSYMDSQVETLRDFRDGYLSTSPLGQGFISAYYRLSPPVAGFIDDHPALKPVVRAGLLPAAGLSTVTVNTTLPEKAAIAGSMLLMSALAVVWLKRKAIALRH